MTTTIDKLIGQSPYEGLLQHSEIRYLRNLLGIEGEKYIKQQIINQRPIDAVMLLCPAYPHDGKSFTYLQGQLLGGGASPMVPHFDKKFSKLKQATAFYNSTARQGIKLHPLICDIESDIPGVIENFCGGKLDFFYQQIESTKTETGNFFQEKYDDIEIIPNTFTSLIGSELLESKMSLVDSYLEDQTKLPNEFFVQARHVATIRASSIKKQYAKETLQEQYQMALRHMKSYLAVSLALSEKFSSGCIVFNNNSPNLYYIKSISKLKQIFDLQDSKFPIFIAT